MSLKLKSKVKQHSSTETSGDEYNGAGSTSTDHNGDSTYSENHGPGVYSGSGDTDNFVLAELDNIESAVHSLRYHLNGLDYTTGTGEEGVKILVGEEVTGTGHENDNEKVDCDAPITVEASDEDSYVCADYAYDEMTGATTTITPNKLAQKYIKAIKKYIKHCGSDGQWQSNFASGEHNHDEDGSHGTFNYYNPTTYESFYASYAFDEHAGCISFPESVKGTNDCSWATNSDSLYSYPYICWDTIGVCEKLAQEAKEGISDEASDAEKAAQKSFLNNNRYSYGGGQCGWGNDDYSEYGYFDVATGYGYHYKDGEYNYFGEGY